MRRLAILFAPCLAFLAGMSAAYGLFAPNPNTLLSFAYIIPMGVSVALVASALREVGGNT